MYHRVAHDSGDGRYTVTAKNFRNQIQYLRERKFAVVSLQHLLTLHESEKGTNKRTVAITFDDGFEDVYHHAIPVLCEFAMPATVFLVSRLVGATNAWNESAGSSHRLITWNQASALHKQGFEMGSHTCTHPVLTDLSHEGAKAEIEDSKKQLEDHLGFAVSSFAYPYGRFSKEVRDLVERAGYARACSTLSGFNGFEADPFTLRRLDIYGADSLASFSRKLTFGSNRVGTRQVAAYYLKRALSRWFS